MKNYLKNWNPVRMLRLALGIFVGVQGILANDWPMMALGALFSVMPLLNMGCCGAAGCHVPAPKNKEQTDDVTYEEVR